MSLLKISWPKLCCLTKAWIAFFLAGLIPNLMNEFVALRSRYTAKLFKELDESKATGPDCIPATILKRIGWAIAVPFTKLCRRLLREACWPKVWCLHHVCPLYKRDSAFAAGNYRGCYIFDFIDGPRSNKRSPEIVRRFYSKCPPRKEEDGKVSLGLWNGKCVRAR